ncbi:MAG: hypothetical protein ACXACX_02550 [Candidatus Hodarchaeales archaeon]|jgi:hypothetical protein
MEKKTLIKSFYSKKIYKFHEYADIFPLMSLKEIVNHGKSIKEFGQEENIVLFNEEILDGRNTYLACRREGITPRFCYYSSDLDPLDYVRIKNYHRRQMSSAQKAAVALVFLEIEKKRAQQRIARTQFNNHNNHKEKNDEKDTASNPRSLAVKGRAIDILAKEHNIASKTLEKARKIDEASKKDPEIKKKWEKAKKNEIPLEEAYRFFREKNETKIKKGIVDKFVETGCKSSKVEGILKDQAIEMEEIQENKCKYCSKATVFAITCEKCGYPTSRVFCDIDFINNIKRLLNPNIKKCTDFSFTKGNTLSFG